MLIHCQRIAEWIYVFTNSPSRRILSNKSYKIHIPDVASVNFSTVTIKTSRSHKRNWFIVPPREPIQAIQTTDNQFAQLFTRFTQLLDTRSNRHCDQHRGIYNRHAFLAWSRGIPCQWSCVLQTRPIDAYLVRDWRRGRSIVDGEKYGDKQAETIVTVVPSEGDLATRGRWGGGGRKENKLRQGTCRRAKARAMARGEVRSGRLAVTCVGGDGVRTRARDMARHGAAPRRAASRRADQAGRDGHPRITFTRRSGIWHRLRARRLPRLDSHVLTSLARSRRSWGTGPARDVGLGVRTDGRTDRPRVPPCSYLVLDSGGGHDDGHLGGSLFAPARPIFSNKRHFAESAV